MPTHSQMHSYISN